MTTLGTFFQRCVSVVLSTDLKFLFAWSVGSELQVRVLVLASVLGQEAEVVVRVAVGAAHRVQDLGAALVAV